MDTLSHLRTKRKQILEVARSYGASSVRVFGSVARGEDKRPSDLDVLVIMERGRTLLDLVGLEEDLSALIGKKVQVVTEGGLSPFLEKRILAEAVPL